MGLAIALAGCGDGGSTDGAGDGGPDGAAVDAGDGGAEDAGGPECASDDDCDSGNPCAAHETCNLDTQECEPAEALDEGAPCGDGRVCEEGFCVLETPSECESDEDCDDGNSCNGVDYCDEETGTCQVRTCDDGDPCTKNVCHDDGPCTFELIDADGDGFAPATECADPDLKGGDCDDTKAWVNPDADEVCDLHFDGRLEEVDNDCDGHDGFAEESELPHLYFRDQDEDGYGDESQGVPCPLEGYVRGGTFGSGSPGAPPRQDFDCFDGPDPDSDGAEVHPGATGYYTDPYCRAGTVAGSPTDGWSCDGADEEPSWDYNCDGTEELAPGEASAICACTDGMRLCDGSGGGGCTPSGWWSSVPDCGENGTWQSCDPVWDDQDQLSHCMGGMETRAQRCR
ncbi:MAG: hypothetical protein ACODAU_03695 [Myxococcota bacterium]